MDSMVMIIQSWNVGTSLGQLEEKIAATQAEGAQIMTEARWVSQGPGWCEWLNGCVPRCVHRYWMISTITLYTYLWYMRKMYYRYDIWSFSYTIWLMTDVSSFFRVCLRATSIPTTPVVSKARSFLGALHLANGMTFWNGSPQPGLLASLHGYAA